MLPNASITPELKAIDQTLVRMNRSAFYVTTTVIVMTKREMRNIIMDKINQSQVNLWRPKRAHDMAYLTANEKKIEIIVVTEPNKHY